MILLRHGANPTPCDGGIPPVIALMDKLVEYEESKSYPYQLVSCLKLIILSISFIEMPFKVRRDKAFYKSRRRCRFLLFFFFSLFICKPLVYETRKELFLKKYSTLFTENLIPWNRAFGVAELKHLCKFVSSSFSSLVVNFSFHFCFVSFWSLTYVLAAATEDASFVRAWG